MKTLYYAITPLVHLPRSADTTFTYQSDDTLPIGSLVKIPFRNKKVRGVVIADVKKKPSYPTKKVLSSITTYPYFFDYELALAQKISVYYLTPLAEVLKLFLPDRLSLKLLLSFKRSRERISKKTIAPDFFTQTTYANDLPLLISSFQKDIANKGTVLFLVPTLATLQPVIANLKERLPKVEILAFHSKLTSQEYENVFTKITSEKPLICVGLRQSLFLPFQSLKRIVMFDAAHDAYKQWDLHPKYHVRELLDIRNEILPTPTTICSFIHSYTDHARAKKQMLTIPEPSWDVFTKAHFIGRTREPFAYNPIDTRLQSTIQETNENWLFFLNRKGYKRLIVCRDCGWEARCPQCDLILIQKSENLLVCSRCNYQDKLPLSCPKCHGTNLSGYGVGIDSLKTFIESFTLGKKAHILDTAPTTSAGLEKKQLLIATDTLLSIPAQPLFKNVVIINADAERSLPYWNAEEVFIQKVWKLANFTSEDGALHIQSNQPEACAELFAKNLYRTHIERILAMRKKLYYPPFGTIFLLTKKLKKDEKPINPPELTKLLKEKKRISYAAQRYVDKRGSWHRITIRYPLPDASFKKELYAIVPNDYYIEINPLNL